MSTYATNETIENTIIDLIGIWKYGALDHHIANGNKKTDQEYVIILISMWDAMDKLPIATIEGVLVELDGVLMKSEDVTYKIIRTQVEQYLLVRLETGECEV